MKVADPLLAGLGARFRFAVMIPVAIPLVIGAGLALSGAPELPPSFPRFLDALRRVTTTQIAAAVAVFVILCILAAPLQLPLIRLLEGYWGDGWFARLFLGIGERRQKRRRRELDSATKKFVDEPRAEDIARISRAAELLRQRFPAEAEILPTALGNALRAGERRAGDRYGFDAVVLWPRLYVLMPKNTKTAINSARDALDLLAGMAVSFIVAAVVALVFTGQHFWWLGFPLALLLMAAIAYHGAVVSAIHYGQMVGVAFDLHRFDLLEALHIPLPSDSATERSLYEPLQKVLRGIPARVGSSELPNLKYSHPKPTQTPGALLLYENGGRNAPEENTTDEEHEGDDTPSEGSLENAASLEPDSDPG